MRLCKKKDKCISQILKVLSSKFGCVYSVAQIFWQDNWNEDKCETMYILWYINTKGTR